VGTHLGELLKKAGVAPAPATKGRKAFSPRTLPPPEPEPLLRVTARPAKPAAETRPLGTSELRMLNDAYAGARPLRAKKPLAQPLAPSPSSRADVVSQARVDDAAARARLAALVAGGLRFSVQRDENFVHGLRSDASPKLLTRLASKGFSPEAKLDLHGKRAAEVTQEINNFVRKAHRQGARSLLIIVGKGLHSQDGVGVLAHAASDALTQGGAAPLVLGFATAHAANGGSGALAVVLQG
jgi:DNA-nicking Smr family endonuclease